MAQLRDLILWGKTLLNQVVRIEGNQSWPGSDGLAVFIQPGDLHAQEENMPTDWGWVECGPQDSSFLYELQVLNPTDAAITFSLARTEEEDGVPAATEAFLAKDVELPSKGVWQFQGKISRSDIYLVGKASAEGLVVWGCGESGASQ
jgi:hypothetical protein